MWFERPASEYLEAWQDNVMWETDYPHPTAQWPTPATSAPMAAAEAIESSLGKVSDIIKAKVLQHNAVRVYNLDTIHRASANGADSANELTNDQFDRDSAARMRSF